MKIHTSDKLIAYLTLLSGLTISAVAVYYSVAGLVSIFAAAAIPIIVMGSALEISKLVATVWLKLNWKRAPIFIRSYLLAAIAVLMVITSMGIFGFLSKAHSDQSIVSGDVQSKIAIYDEKIKTAKDNIDANRKALKQMDEAVDQTMVRSTTEGGADKAVQIRRSQQKERARLAQDIEAEQKKINQLMDERAPIAAEVRAVEAEVGPIKYIAAFVYGDNPDANVLEKAVTWVIIIIVSVFDPLAVILLLASQYSFQWFRQAEEEKTPTQDINVDPDPYVPTETIIEPIPEAVTEQEPVIEKRNFPGVAITDISGDLSSPNRFGIETVVNPIIIETPFKEDFQEEDYTVERPGDYLEKSLFVDEEILDDADHDEKEAMKRWKDENPEDSLKHQRKLYELKLIDRLPWQEQIAAKPDYVQNAEQGESTIWQKLKAAKDDER